MNCLTSFISYMYLHDCMYMHMLHFLFYSCTCIFQALNIFKYLIEHGNRNSLVSHVTVLDPLPNGPLYCDIKNKLDSLKSPDGLSLMEVHFSMIRF